MANLIKPGDYVNVLVNKVTSAASGPEGSQGQPALFADGARYVYQKVRVLAVDQSAVPQAGEGTAPGGAQAAQAPAPAPAAVGSGLLTLIVPAKGAQYLASVPPQNIYLTLVAPDYRPVPQDSLDPRAPLPAEDDTILTPYGKDGAEASN